MDWFCREQCHLRLCQLYAQRNHIGNHPWYFQLGVTGGIVLSSLLYQIMSHNICSQMYLIKFHSPPDWSGKWRVRANHWCLVWWKWILSWYHLQGYVLGKWPGSTPNQQVSGEMDCSFKRQQDEERGILGTRNILYSGIIFIILKV